MRKYTKILSLVMAILMITVLFCGCQRKSEKTEALAVTENLTTSKPKSEAEEIEALAGTWEMPMSVSESVAQTLLESIDLSAEEIACVDLTTLEFAKIVKFTMDGTYQFAYDPDGTRACAIAFFEDAFDAMYEKRASLGQLYDVDFESASKEEFLQFYADLYSTTDFSALLEMLADNCFDYDALAEPLEEGTYSVQDGVISMTILGQSEADTVEYVLGAGILRLTYVDGVEVYSK